MKYLILDARYEKAHQDGVVRDAAVLTAIGIGEDERRHVLGVSVKLSEAEVHWRDFLQSLNLNSAVGARQSSGKLLMLNQCLCLESSTMANPFGEAL